MTEYPERVDDWSRPLMYNEIVGEHPYRPMVCERAGCVKVSER